jgi:hypothetical protein
MLSTNKITNASDLNRTITSNGQEIMTIILWRVAGEFARRLL